MFSIDCKDIAKKFRKEILFKDFNYSFKQPNSYAIIGSNSSGKSTLLKIVGGVMLPNKGGVEMSTKQEVHDTLSFSSPEMELLEDYTVQQSFDLHFSLRKPLLPVKEIIEKTQLSSFMEKTNGELSSGLKNKVKLSLALFTQSEALLLDEPCTNFDQTNTDWYLAMMEKYWQDKLVIIASNQKEEYSFCNEKINLHDYKPNTK